MNRKVLRNKAQLMHAIDRKKLYKSGKRWLIGSTLLLALAGGASVATGNHVQANADSTKTEAVQPKAKFNLQSQQSAGSSASQGAKPATLNPNNVQSDANNVHSALSHTHSASSNASSASPKSVAPSASNQVSGSSSASSVNSSPASKVNNKASGNQTVSPSSASAKSDSNSSTSSKPVVHMLGGGNPLDAQAPKATQQASDGYWIWTNNGYISDNQAGQWKTNQELTQPNYYGLTWKYNEANKAIKFTGGTLTWNGNGNFWSNNPYVSQAKSMKFDNVDTHNLTNANYMFYNSTLVSLDLGDYFDASHITNMGEMFNSMHSVKSILLPNFNTASATSMDHLFGTDGNLQQLDLGNSFNPSHVKNLSGMFYDDGLQSLTLPQSFNTQSATDMSSMFEWDGGIKSLSLPSSFITNSVTNMNSMFRGMGGLTNISFGNKFNTSDVTDMGSMFSDDHSIQNLTLPDTFNTKSVHNMEHMFDSDYNLQNLKLDNNFNTSNVSDMYMMFIRDGKSDTNSHDMNLTLSPEFDTTLAVSNNSASTDQGTHNGIDDMFQYANIDSLTIPQGANFKLNNQANLKPLYQKDSNDNHTAYKSHNFTNTYNNQSTEVYTNENIIASDIYSGFDGIKSPLTINSNNNQDWSFVNTKGQIVSKPITNSNHHYLVAPSYEGLVYKYTPSTKSIEFTNGTLTWNGNGNWKAFWGLYNDAPQAIHNAKHFKFDDAVNTNNLTDTSSMFESDRNVESIDFGNNFNTSNVTDMHNMFSGTHNLKYLNLKSFNTDKVNNIQAMLEDSTVTTITLPSTVNLRGTLMDYYTWYPVATNNGQLEKGSNGKYITKPVSKATNLTDGNSHAGTWVRTQNILVSDIYNHDDDIKLPQTLDNINDTTDNGIHWTYVDVKGNISKKPITNAQNRALIAPIANGLTYRYDKETNSIEFVSGTLQWNGGSFFQWGQSSFLRNLKHIKFDNTVNIGNTTNLDYFLYHNSHIQTINLGDNFDTHRVNSMFHMFSDDESLKSLNLGNKFNTSDVTNMDHIFASDPNLHTLILPTGFTTTKTGSWNKFANNNLDVITLPSTAKFNSHDALSNSWYQVASKGNQLEKDGNGNYITIPNAPKTNLMDSNSHTGTWVKNPNPQKVTNTITFTDSKTGDLVGSTTAYGALNSDYTINQAPKGYKFINNDNTFKIVSPDTKVSIPVAKSSATDNANKDIPVAPTRDTDTIDYQYNGNTKGSQQFSGNDQHAKDAGDNSIDVNSKAATKMPAGYQLVNKDDSVPYDNGTHNVAITPIQQTDNIQFMNNGHQVGTTTTKGNDSRTGINGNSTATLPMGYQLAKGASASVANDGKTHQINITPIQKTDTINYQLNGITKGSNQFTGNDAQANGATGTSFNVNSSNDAGIPSGYQLVNKDNRFNYDGGTHNVVIEATGQSAKVNYNLSDGTNVGTGTISGNVNTSTTPNKAPQGYHFVGNVTPYNFTTANAGNNPSDNVTVAPNTYNGTATVYVKYDLGNGNIVNGTDQHVNVSGQYGQSDQVVSSTNYCPMNDAYQDHNANWLIDFNDLTKNGSVNNGRLEHTFTYNATKAPSLVIRYDLIDTTNNDKVVQKDIHDDTFTASQLGIKPQDWVVGNTITVGTKKSGDTNPLDVISAPEGYHLVNGAKGFDYNNWKESIQLEPNAQVSGHPVVLMAMPMFFHHSNKPAKPNTPVKPSGKASSNATPASTAVNPFSSANASQNASSSQSSSSSNNSSEILSQSSQANSSVAPASTKSSNMANTSTEQNSNVSNVVVPSQSHSKAVPTQNSNKNSFAKPSNATDNLQKDTDTTKTESIEKVQNQSSDNGAPVSNVVSDNDVNASEPEVSSNVNVPATKQATNQQNGHKLSQTNENRHAGIFAMIAIAISAFFTNVGKAIERKHQE